MTTDYVRKLEILRNLWVNYSDDEDFKDFVEMNDLGLPLAYLISNGIVSSTPLAEQLVNASFSELLEMFDVDDVGFVALSQIIKTA